MHSIQFGNRTIPYHLSTSKRRKTLSISVDQHGVSVVSPYDVDREKIEAVLHQKAAWIIRQLADFEEMEASAPKRMFLSGEKLPYLGRQYRLKVEKTENTKATFRFYQGRFFATVPPSTPMQEQRSILRPLYIEWLKKHGMDFVRERIKRFTMRLQHEPYKIQIRELEQRWGSCTPAGNILLNWRIFLAPASIIDYVLAHELVHLKYMNHSKEYWETLRMLLPDYEKRKEWLRINGRTLDI